MLLFLLLFLFFFYALFCYGCCAILLCGDYCGQAEHADTLGLPRTALPYVAYVCVCVTVCVGVCVGVCVEAENFAVGTLKSQNTFACK